MAKGKKESGYPASMREEELKNRVAADWFAGRDAARILGNVDFCVEADGESLVWAEAKRGAAPLDFALVQLILTIGKERTFDRNLPPRFLAAFNASQIWFLPYSDVAEVFYQNDFNWNVAPSDHSTREFRELHHRVSKAIADNSLVFAFDEDAKDLRKFLKRALGRAVSMKPPCDERRVEGNAPYQGDERRVAAAAPYQIQITKNNFTHIYHRWREAVMPTILMPDWAEARKGGVIDADFFLADIFSSDNAAVLGRLNVLLMDDRYRQTRGRDTFGLQLFTEITFSDGQRAHRTFWNRYKSPPRKEYWEYIVNRRDLLVPQDVRERKGSFFTPRRWVELSQDYLARALGEDWQDECVVWDCCAGTGNLLAGLTNKYSVWASTLDQADVDAMRQRIKFGANLLDSHVFQFDFLNDPFDKLPQGLRDVIADPARRKKLVIYINPPYAEGDNRKGVGRSGVASGTMVAEKYGGKMGYSKRELFIQFLTRIHEEIPGCTIGQFSTLTHLSGFKFDEFRRSFKGELLSSFLVPADTFDNVKGQFPIGFFVWRLWGDFNAEAQSRREGGSQSSATGKTDADAAGRAVSMKPPRDERHGRAACPQAAAGDELRRVEGNAPYQGDDERRVEGNAPYQGDVEEKNTAKGKRSGLASCESEVDPHLDDAKSIAYARRGVNGGKSNAEGLRSGSSGETPALSRTLGDIKSLAYSIFAVNGESNGVFSSAIADVYDKKGEYVGKKTILSYDGLKPINDWIVQFASNDYSDRSMGTIIAVANYFQNRGTINLCEPNKKWNHKFQWQVLPENVMVSSIYFAVRLCIEHTVMNHNDQFLFPNGGWESDAEFQMDCLVYTLFHGKNRIMSADGVNHWIPFTEEEVGAKDNFASHFMSEVLAGRLSRRVEGNAPYQGELELGAAAVSSKPPYQAAERRVEGNAPYQGRDEARSSRPDGAATAGAASPAARAALDAGRALWRHYHALPDANPNASFYDIRLRFQGVAVDSRGKAKMNADSPDAEYTRLLAALRAAHRALAAKIEPKIYEYGFLRK